MKLWLKKKDFLNTGWPSSVLQTPKKIGYDESLLFLHMQLEKTYFFFYSQFWPWEKQKYA